MVFFVSLSRYSFRGFSERSYYISSADGFGTHISPREMFFRPVKIFFVADLDWEGLVVDTEC